MSYFFPLLLSLFVLINPSSAITCPQVECLAYEESMETDNLCLWHSGDIPTTSVKLRSCNDIPNQVCDLNNFNSFAWPNVSVQFKTNTAITDPTKSPLYQKQTKVQCKDKNDLQETGLYNGRRCLEDYQCLSRNCEWNTGFCKGRSVNESCSDHVDCDNGLACMPSSKWPYATVCKAQLAEDAICTSEYECKNSMGCIKIQNTTSFRCTKYYTLNDATLFYLLNSTVTYSTSNITKDALVEQGKFCKSGLANRFYADLAQCVTIDSVRVTTDINNTVSSPFSCRADGNVNCIYYSNNIASPRFTINCECGFDSGTGYCPVPDQRFMNSSSNLMYKTLSYSNCHTYDRFNMLAQKDCGMPYIDVNQTYFFKVATDYQFQLKYWTFTRTQTAYNCMNGIFPTSVSSVMAFGKIIQISAYGLVIAAFISLALL